MSPSRSSTGTFAEHVAFGDGAAVMTAPSRVFYSDDGHTFVPALLVTYDDGVALIGGITR